ncbi:MULTISPECIES: PP2C family protein-serine/threonine phosphatase [Comamonas]|jgi:serine/threonine protein phosphatase PrpC|uniref:PP2C family protein-serine/threonine phosphatase n=1 Tax=Comamonas TaxID=283 RepID=UPI0012C8D65F|nr:MULTISPECIES: protein phosphatase 2C domain-containing protein [Comamonas]MDR3065958.1 protein phosphatase 2C domain-containing protein [Comamonas sp.]MEB5963836.1 protein phosphatase 2C domain-containing protein [Comamonas testosteroni]MPS95885.1 serine/threonine-protein phosphatase [Comamonas sp.]
MKFSVFQLSRRGGRALNEDRMGYCYTREAALFVLADGMGGHPDGEVAAQIALQVVSTLFQQKARPQLEEPAQFLEEALLLAHRQILRYASGKGMMDTPRTTLVAAVLQEGKVTWIHCGDSRLYWVREGQLVERTRDHSYTEMRKVSAMLAQANRNVLFTCLGSPSKPIFDVSETRRLEEGDQLMLCSDGLWGAVPTPEILQIMSGKAVAHFVPMLVDTALKRAGDGSDNVTVLALVWETPNNFEPSSISTQEIEDQGFESTIQVGALEDCEDELDDAAIERSIAEINEAIRRSAQRPRTKT